MNSLKRVIVIVLVSLGIVSCSADLQDYKETYPAFNLFEYFTGKTEAWGMVQDYTGKQTRRFHVSIDGIIKDHDTLVLTELFKYDDGEEDTRIWTIRRKADGSYVGKADDILGEATGYEQGNAFRWRYDFELELDDGSIEVHFDDWLYRQDEKHLFNLTSIRKFGVEVGTVTLFFKKQ
jgi:hypothetical protein